MLSILLASTNISYAQTVWTGNDSSDWFEVENWTNGIPSTGNDAAIPSSPPGNFLPIVDQDITIDFTIENDNILTFFGDVTNHNTIINFEDGSIISYGEIENLFIIDNDGELFSAGNITNAGNFDNSGKLQFDFGDEFLNTVDGRFSNFGPIILVNTRFTNRGELFINGGSLETSGSFENFGLIVNNGLIKNLECGVFINNGEINNILTIENANLFYNENLFTGNPVIDLISLENTTGITVANFECEDEEGWTHYYDSTNQKILLSVFKGGIDIGSVIDQSLIIEINNDQKLGTGSVNNYTDALYSNSDNWYTINRSWNIKSSLADTSLFNVRFYFENGDFEEIQNTFPITQNTDELVFFKLLDSENAFDPTVPNTNVSSFVNTSSPSPTTWSHHNLSFSPFAEIQTVGLNGAYGAGVKSWLGGTIPFQLSFDAFPNNQSQSVNLEWSTSSESESEEYILQKSDDGISFTDFKTIPAQGNTNNISQYAEQDISPNLIGPTFYRIKLIRLDGSERFSPTRAVSFSSGEISIFPNPSRDELYIKFDDLEQGEVNFDIYNMSGHKIYSDIFEIENSITTENLYDKTKLEAGIYSLRINGVGKTRALRFIKVSR